MRAAADRIDAEAGTWRAPVKDPEVQHALFWGVPRWCVRAYVWAVYCGEDPLLAVAQAHWGRDMPIGPGHDPCWDDPQRRYLSRTLRAICWTKGCEAVGVDIPRARAPALEAAA
ncbi:MAG: hypothetical protein WDM92_16690 [Caulobacteraceae bacterium]